MTVIWPDVPHRRVRPYPYLCDRCGRDAEPGSALCGWCEDEHLRTEKEDPDD